MYSLTKNINLLKAMMCGAVLSLCTGTMMADGYPTDVTSDLTLIYKGGTHRPDWTKEQIEPYVVHTYANGDRQWFFDAFLFLEFTNGSGTGYGTNLGNTANRSDWEWLLDRMFVKDTGMDALDQLIGELKTELGDPGFKHRVVVSCPSPIKDYTEWGSLDDGTVLTFNRQSHREKAVYWYIDQIISRFNAFNFKNIELEGIYWIEEHALSGADFLKKISTYVHGKDLRFYWIPYYTANGYQNWESLGFDIAYMQPNHYFNKEISDDRLDTACKLCKQYGLGLELEFETQGSHQVQYAGEDSYYSRLVSYIDTFEKYGVWDESAVAYYSGTKGFLDLSKSTTPEDHAITDRIASIVEKRHKAWIAGVTDVVADTPVAAAAGIGEIVVAESDSRVYSVDGRLVFSGAGKCLCPAGMYIVSAPGKKTVKLIVR